MAPERFALGLITCCNSEESSLILLSDEIQEAIYTQREDILISNQLEINLVLHIEMLELFPILRLCPDVLVPCITTFPLRIARTGRYWMYAVARASVKPLKTLKEKTVERVPLRSDCLLVVVYNIHSQKFAEIDKQGRP